MMIDDQDALFSWFGAFVGNEVAVFRLVRQNGCSKQW